MISKTLRAALPILILLLIMLAGAVKSSQGAAHSGQRDGLAKEKIVLKEHVKDPFRGEKKNTDPEIKPISFSTLDSADGFCKSVNDGFLVFIHFESLPYDLSLPSPTISFWKYDRILFRRIISPNAP
jgi:hypothetical protein